MGVFQRGSPIKILYAFLVSCAVYRYLLDFTTLKVLGYLHNLPSNITINTWSSYIICYENNTNSIQYYACFKLIFFIFQTYYPNLWNEQDNNCGPFKVVMCNFICLKIHYEQFCFCFISFHLIHFFLILFHFKSHNVVKVRKYISVFQNQGN